jgi:hypothetical protein
LGVRTGELAARQAVELRIPFDAPLHHGEYIISIMASNATRTEAYGSAGYLVSFDVGGVVVERGAAALQEGFRCRVLSDEGVRVSADIDADADRGGVS